MREPMTPIEEAVPVDEAVGRLTDTLTRWMALRARGTNYAPATIEVWPDDAAQLLEANRKAGERIAELEADTAFLDLYDRAQKAEAALASAMRVMEPFARQANAIRLWCQGPKYPGTYPDTHNIDALDAAAAFLAGQPVPDPVEGTLTPELEAWAADVHDRDPTPDPAPEPNASQPIPLGMD